MLPRGKGVSRKGGGAHSCCPDGLRNTDGLAYCSYSTFPHLQFSFLQSLYLSLSRMLLLLHERRFRPVTGADLGGACQGAKSPTRDRRWR